MKVALFVVLLAVILLCPARAGGSGDGKESARSERNFIELLSRDFAMGESPAVTSLSWSEIISLQLVRLGADVRPHIHERHTETVTILEGEGIFQIGEERLEARPGDVFLIPAGTVHAFTLTGKGPAAALTSFSPGFDGKDRVFLDAGDGR